VTFRVLKEVEESQFGEYRTKRLILVNYEKMQLAVEAGAP
jgi:hypothetical protein